MVRYTKRRSRLNYREDNRDPDAFNGVISTNRVVIEGDYPEIKKAYEAIGVPVEVILPKPEKK